MELDILIAGGGLDFFFKTGFYCVALAGLKYANSPASASGMQRLHVCATTTSFKGYFGSVTSNSHLNNRFCDKIWA